MKSSLLSQNIMIKKLLYNNITDYIAKRDSYILSKIDIRSLLSDCDLQIRCVNTANMLVIGQIFAYAGKILALTKVSL